MDLIKHHSRVIAKAILERTVLNVDDIAALIQNRITDILSDLIKDKATNEQRLYDEKLSEVSRYKVGTQKYVEVAYELSKIKRRKALANKAANEAEKNLEYKLCKEFVIERYGKDALKDFFEAMDERVKVEVQK